ncbi:hypothetical protein [Hymenobacter fodinae]|uniref:Uncharacterized protein n=1 Tax=Hymenobacter fodinae TaxID=2510796 RepID=A0A4Z0P8R6_9BACT|nr:hypothetical protein [Hymenobacter fodinae]TGE08772.1 hypothetical protein EU556_13885 [Hymenobacter fodinae]
MELHRINIIKPYGWNGPEPEQHAPRGKVESIEQQIIEEYTRRMPAILEMKRSTLKIFALGYEYEWPENSYSVENALRGAGVAMYHKFPVLSYLVSFADPHNKIALLVQEKHRDWSDPATLQSLKFTLRILSNLGWTVYCLSEAVINTVEADLLPDHLKGCPMGEYESDAQHQEYLVARAQLTFLTLDGFARYLRGLRDELRKPRPTQYATPEAEAEALMNRNASQSNTKAIFEAWARKRDMPLETYPTGKYMHYRTAAAYEAWAAGRESMADEIPGYHTDHGDFGPVG